MTAKKSDLGEDGKKASKKLAAVKTAKRAVRADQEGRAKTGRPAKAVKLVRESFRFPAEDHALFAPLKARAKLAGRPAKKEELVRAALRVLMTLDTSELIEQLRQLEAKAR
jgi:hypothetical protein